MNKWNNSLALNEKNNSWIISFQNWLFTVKQNVWNLFVELWDKKRDKKTKDF